MSLPPVPPKALSVLLVYSWLLWTGYQRRRASWTRASWVRFAGALAAAFAALAVALGMARGVDNGVYGGMSRAAHDLYFYTMFGLLLGGLCSACGLVLWFAKGDPERQFGGPRARTGGVASRAS